MNSPSLKKSEPEVSSSGATTSKWIWIRNNLEKNLGFYFSELSTFDSCIKLLHQPRDPSNLAVIRIFFGFLMILDTFAERGFLIASNKWGDPRGCRFPYFDFLKPLPLEWMYALYFVMFIGAVGMMLGWHFRVSCLIYIIPYWYIFLLEKSYWNNHSYLFGLLTMQLMLSGANRCWSLDGLRKPWLQNSHVPLWNYCLLRGQIFLVYFIAGLKKTDLDWLGGYSMPDLGKHWVFGGFRFIMDDRQIAYFIVHLGGFLLDLTVGFFMILDFSRPFAYVFCAAFNSMNSRMFRIGMFPYVMIAVMPIFSGASWPKNLFRYCPEVIKRTTLYDFDTKTNPICIYEQNVIDTRGKENMNKDGEIPSPARSKRNLVLQRKLTVIFLCIYFGIQGFLPYSHWLTKGYNTWTSGPYGYSWDMMIHGWSHMHTSITVVEKNTGKQYYLDPKAWTRNSRWSTSADMVKQLSYCIEQRLKDEHNITNIEMYIDSWISLNGRFVQRMFDPTVDVLKAEWSTFREVSWVLPFLAHLSKWRPKLQQLKNRFSNETDPLDGVFMADFPGFQLTNYIDKETTNTTLTVLKGVVEVAFPFTSAIILKAGDNVEIPSGHFHKVTPLQHKLACYMYTFPKKINVTQEATEKRKITTLDKCNYLHSKNLANAYISKIITALSFPCHADTRLSQYFKWQYREDKLLARKESEVTFTETFHIWKKSMILLAKAFFCILTASPMPLENEKAHNI